MYWPGDDVTYPWDEDDFYDPDGFFRDDDIEWGYDSDIDAGLGDEPVTPEGQPVTSS